MEITEIFYSLQGEGKWTGQPNIFIRTSGCNLRCSYCDTKYAYQPGESKTIDEIIKKISKYPCKHVCVTGGEPLIQDQTSVLIDTLLKNKYKICVETNGTKYVDIIPKNKDILISLDVKCPSSNMHKKMRLENINLLQEKDQIKFVVKDENDYNYAKNVIEKYSPICEVFIQPVWKTDYKKVVERILEDGLNVRLGLQLHKIIKNMK
ncbi:MAG: radical SAM protein [Candidatus Thermoplasmatota archaeon]